MESVWIGLHWFALLHSVLWHLFLHSVGICSNAVQSLCTPRNTFSDESYSGKMGLNCLQWPAVERMYSMMCSIRRGYKVIEIKSLARSTLAMSTSINWCSASCTNLKPNSQPTPTTWNGSGLSACLTSCNRCSHSDIRQRNWLVNWYAREHPRVYVWSRQREHSGR